MEERQSTRKWTIALFIIYLIALFWIIIFKFDLSFSNFGYARSINLIPFHESLIINGKIDFSEIIMNVIIFMPLGIYAGLLFKKSAFWQKCLLFLFVSFMCETAQYILGVGTSDITDLITNTIGGVMGLFIYIGVKKILKDDVKTQKFINCIATIGTVFMILLLSVLVISNL